MEAPQMKQISQIKPAPNTQYFSQKKKNILPKNSHIDHRVSQGCQRQ